MHGDVSKGVAVVVLERRSYLISIASSSVGKGDGLTRCIVHVSNAGTGSVPIPVRRQNCIALPATQLLVHAPRPPRVR